MKETNKNKIYSLTLSAVFIALATVLSFIKVYKLPMGGAITLFSMLPIVMLSFLLGVKKGLVGAFCYSLLQLLFGITMDGLFGWGLTPTALIGTIFLDYIIPFTALGLSAVFGKNNIFKMLCGITLALFLRFVCHFLSGVIIFGVFASGDSWIYSLTYNGSYMLPKLIITTISDAILFSLPQIKKMMK